MTHALSSGLITAPVLPFEDNGDVDWKHLGSYMGQIAEARPTAIAMNMALSEVSSLEPEEQLQVIRTCRKAISGEVPLLSGVSATHTRAAVAMARRLVDEGVDGLVIFPSIPTFVGAPTLQMIVDYHAAIAEVSSLPVLAFQNVFSKYPPGTIKALSKIPNLVSIKDASFDVEQTWENVKEARSCDRKIGVLTGSDTFILEAMLMGCDGALIGFAATATAELVRMQKLAAQGKATEAYEIWNKLGPLARACWRTPLRDYRVRTKYALVKQGVLKNTVVRAPLAALTEVDRVNIDEAFTAGSLLDARFKPAGR